MSHNPIRPWRNIDRRKTRQIHVGPVPVGGDAPITVQTMTNTLTTDVKATVEQVQACAEAGADIVRISVPDEASSKALKEIVPESPVPIVADIHFHYKRGIEARRRARPACGSTPAISATRPGCGRSSRPPATMIARSASG
jgi:(E)-4-hydroxy-3-methylbut-2-enyl-diphosphate synthase